KIWKLSSTRPVNHPQRRLAALTILVQEWPAFRRSLEKRTAAAIEKFFDAFDHPFWKFHYTMTADASLEPMALVGESRVADILANVIFPVFQGVLERAKKLQAKNDLTQIVTAVNAFYTEYGKYPLATADTIYGTGGTSNADLFYSLRAVAFGANALVNGVPAVNTRQIVFISPPDVKNPANPSLG